MHLGSMFSERGDSSRHTLPLCSHYAGGENDERVRDVLLYAAGLATNLIAPIVLFDRIERLHDHKGWLYILVWKPLGKEVEGCFRRAWGEIGIEERDYVSF